MRNNVVLCANKTVKSNVLHPCVDTLKKKLQAFELQHMVQNILCRTSKERALIFYQHNLRHFSPLKNNREIETKVLPQFNRPFSIKKRHFNLWIHNANSTSHLLSLIDMEEESNHFVQTESLAQKFCAIV